MRSLARAFVAVLAGAGATFLIGCATVPQPFAPPHEASADLQTLSQRERQLTSLQAPAIMEYSGPGGHVKARETITLERPSSLRVEAMSPLGVALVVTADANQIAVFDPGKNTLTRGTASAATLDRVARIPLAPARAVLLLLALPPNPQLLTGPPTAVAREDESNIVKYNDSDGTTELAFRNGNLATLRQRDPDGAISFEVSYSDYRDIGAMEFPYSIKAVFPPSSTTLSLMYQDPVIDREIPSSQFLLSPGPDTKELTFSRNQRGSDA